MTHQIIVSREKRGLGHREAAAEIKKAVKMALAAEGITEPCLVSVCLTDDEGIRPRLLGAEQLRMRLFFLPLTPQSVECYENPHPETMGVGAEFRDVFETVARRLAGTEIRTRDIYGIGTAVNGCDADFFVPGGGQQLKRLHYFRASSIFLASAPYLGSLAALV